MAAGTVIGQRHETAAGATRRLQLPLRFAGGLIATAMFVCAFALWTAVPAAIVFAMPRATHAEVALPVVLAVVFAAMLAMGKVLALLNGAYCRVMAIAPPRPRVPGWRHSYCEPNLRIRESSVLETAVAASAVTCVLAIAVWFLFFAQCGQGFCSG